MDSPPRGNQSNFAAAPVSHEHRCTAHDLRVRMHHTLKLCHLHGFKITCNEAKLPQHFSTGSVERGRPR